MTQHDTARVRADNSARVRADNSARVRADNSARVRADRLPWLDGDPLVATARRIRGFLREGWRFQTGLAERIPRLYLSGGSL